MSYDAVDLFAGCGGWSVGLRALGGREIGIETDPSCRATRRAAGFHTVQGDVREYGPTAFGSTAGLIASPPCQTFSTAGKGTGRANLDAVLLAVKATAARLPVEATWSDARTGLVVEPLRWAIEAVDAGHPYRWIALEQVRPVLPVWQAYAEALTAEGYHVVTGIVHAEQYGVPQTRARAVLLAHRDRAVSLPTPTHSRYYARDRARLDPGVLPWVSMIEAVDWGRAAPSPTITGGGTDRGTADPYGARTRTELPLEPGWVSGRYLVNGSAGKAGVRDATDPAPTIRGGHDTAARCWKTDHPATRVRVTVTEAAVLQSFPADYPLRGTETARYRQVGDAVPPLLAEALLREVIS